MNLGMGSAVSVLIFLCVMAIAVLYVHLFGGALLQGWRRE